MIETTIELSGRVRAMLRAVAAGRAELSGGGEPDLYVDGLPCSDRAAIHDLVHLGLVRALAAVRLDERAGAELTEAGRAAIA
ncbi:hypothetical protein KCV87_22730 [Actinosynnema pretiosum subsp. pretiosum]|uniref:Uncharacterized protein n=2 Tax=Actinosynnema TaxID=40566 RepID=C6WN84_ACTMD|nr:hypothetical protein [Actinosynnema mirum]ACU40448.1 hypothetical protein Amir_6651 [Actinosynnema mirum DSM 43827]AXX33962.1 hypothetical protein APASM_6597 [Actinosynnema pretiosum subsp. pretiosum]QUF02292.1 hypothetical protein KCV87_22730 [Actinosynnema pretiosum subsp. pretiosum]